MTADIRPPVNPVVFDGMEFTLEEWLEDRGRFSRFSVEKGGTLWICNKCEHVDDECECTDEVSKDPFDYD